MAISKDSKSKTSISAYDLELQLAVRKALDHLLSYPTLTVGLVSDHEKFQKYFSTCAAYKTMSLANSLYTLVSVFWNTTTKTIPKAKLAKSFEKADRPGSFFTWCERRQSIKRIKFCNHGCFCTWRRGVYADKKKNKRLDHIVIERLGSSLKGPQDVSSNELRELLMSCILCRTWRLFLSQSHKSCHI